ncbi:hypothetical protein [Arthrobacter celericrescens]|uniref:hypothetical protein n=1 Tax=Arthrobacter celericrescens TaxID=2320851 RepID=UPI001FE17C09|nr:hypothetical protein [Arthrobacter celericrescens]
MNPDAGPRPQLPAQREAAEAAQSRTQLLFRSFLLTVLGAAFVYSLNVSYVWLSGILTLAAWVLGVVVVVRTVRLRQSRILLYGTISGLVVSAVLGSLVAFSAMFFSQVSAVQECSRNALTDRALNSCTADFGKSLPPALRQP